MSARFPGRDAGLAGRGGAGTELKKGGQRAIHTPLWFESTVQLANQNQASVKMPVESTLSTKELRKTWTGKSSRARAFSRKPKKARADPKIAAPKVAPQ